MAKEKVFLTGASGSMGFQAFKELWKLRDKYNIVLLQRPSGKNKQLFEPYEKEYGIQPVTGKGITESQGNELKIVWGDASSYDDILEAVNGVDWVLSPMAFIAPAADHNPDMAKKVNTTAMEYIVKAIKAQPNGAEHIKLVSIGSVAQYGDRLQTIHMARTGDPLKPSIFDFYATTKIGGERAVIDSGIKHWASMRQTYIAIPDAISLLDPIMFHQPIDTHIEMNTNADAGYGLIQCLKIPEESDFWGRVYNFAGGPSCRFRFIDYIRDMFKIFGIDDYREVMDRNWFALRNFHCCWFEDSHVLNNYLGHWRDTLQDHFKQVEEALPWYVRMGKIPGINSLSNSKPIQKMIRAYIKQWTEGKDGTMYWIKNNNQGRITAFFGSTEKYKAIQDWHAPMPEICKNPIRLNHGYDESKTVLDYNDLKGAAEFRGGKITSPDWDSNMSTVLNWKCAFDHEFTGSPSLILKGGHWCPTCQAPPWNFDEVARRNPFFAQIWYPNHDKDENNFYPEDCYKDIL